MSVVGDRSWWARKAVGFGASLVLGGLLVGWAARGTSIDTVLAHFSHDVQVMRLLGAFGLFAFSFYGVDLVAFTTLWRRHLVATLTVGETAPLVIGKQLFGVVFPPLSKLVGPLFFARRHGLGVVRVVGTSEVVGLVDVVVVSGWVAITALGADVDVGIPRGLLCSVLVVGVMVLLWIRRGIPPVFGALRQHSFFQSLRTLTPGELALQALLRLVHYVVVAVACGLFLSALGLHLELPRLLTFVPLVVFSASVPVSVWGFGGPQGVATLLLAHRWAVCSPSEAFAVSIAWSIGVLCVQIIPAALVAPRLLSLLRGPRHP